ncbi:hypothetical protein TNCV_1566811 [Trichonephila clavipes]|nr:hypothetical protein TNCV_1566811 [Trichonephila clavipes]
MLSCVILLNDDGSSSPQSRQAQASTLRSEKSKSDFSDYQRCEHEIFFLIAACNLDATRLDVAVSRKAVIMFAVLTIHAALEVIEDSCPPAYKPTS